MELSSGLALFLSMGGVSADSKRALMDIYTESGYDCATYFGIDYKTCHRRAMASASLYNHVGHDQISEWCAGTAEMMSITAISKAIEPFKLTTINAAMAFVGKPVNKPRTEFIEQVDQGSVQQDVEKAVHKHHSSIEIDSEAQYDEWLKKRGATPLLKPEAIDAGFRNVSTEHLAS